MVAARRRSSLVNPLSVPVGLMPKNVEDLVPDFKYYTKTGTDRRFPQRGGSTFSSGGSIGLDQRSSFGTSRVRMTRAGTPPTTVFAGTSFVTTELVPTMELSPTVTPRRKQAP